MSFSPILRSSTLFGGVSVIVLAMSFLRMKAIALMIGPDGVGLAGFLVSFSTIIAMCAEWGLPIAGVRLIASALPANQASKIASVRSLGVRLSWVGLFAAALLFLPIGWWTFHPQDQHILELGLAGLAVPMMVASGMWRALLQASGHLRVLSITQVASAFVGITVGLPLIYVFCQAGYSFIGVAIGMLVAVAGPFFFMWWAARKYCPVTPGIVRESDDIRILLRMGGGIMGAYLFTQLSAYLVRWIIHRNFGLESVGYYQAAFTIATALPQFIFAAMASSFFPQVAAAKDTTEARSLVEYQIQAGLLLAMPVLAVLLTMGRTCIDWLYADGKFDPAIPLLSWMAWGVFFRLISWPIGFWLQARGSVRSVLLIEFISCSILGVLPWALVGIWGLTGAGVAFFLGYVAYAFILSIFMRWKTGHWLNIRTWTCSIFAGVALLIAQFSVSGTEGDFWGLIPTAVISLVCGVLYFYAMRSKLKISDSSL